MKKPFHYLFGIVAFFLPAEHSSALWGDEHDEKTNDISEKRELGSKNTTNDIKFIVAPGISLRRSEHDHILLGDVSLGVRFPHCGGIRSCYIVLLFRQGIGGYPLQGYHPLHNMVMSFEMQPEMMFSIVKKIATGFYIKSGLRTSYTRKDLFVKEITTRGSVGVTWGIGAIGTIYDFVVRLGYEGNWKYTSESVTSLPASETDLKIFPSVDHGVDFSIAYYFHLY